MQFLLESSKEDSQAAFPSSAFLRVAFLDHRPLGACSAVGTAIETIGRTEASPELISLLCVDRRYSVGEPSSFESTALQASAIWRA